MTMPFIDASAANVVQQSLLLSDEVLYPPPISYSLHIYCTTCPNIISLEFEKYKIVNKLCIYGCQILILKCLIS